MDSAYRLRPAADKALQRVWDVWRQILSKRGVDVRQSVDRWVQAQRLTFRNPQTVSDYDELCAHGCHPPVLALLLVLLKNAPRLAELWVTYVGQPKARKSASKILEAAASTLEEVFAKTIALEDDEVRQQLRELDRVPLSILITELRLYSNLLGLSEIFKTEIETRSPTELARYLLTYYVQRATKKPHDRQVASLLGEAQDREFYDEVAQRMWRDRNYQRLSRHHRKLGELAYAIGVVVTRKT